MKFYFQFLTALRKFDYILLILLIGATHFFADSFYVRMFSKSRVCCNGKKAVSMYVVGARDTKALERVM